MTSKRFVGFCQAFAAVMAMAFWLPGAGAGQICSLRLDCPLSYGSANSAETLFVPNNVVELSKDFRCCAGCMYPEPPMFYDTLSVMLVIDHSANMAVADSTGARYRFASQLIDSIVGRFPMSEVGIVVFSNQLMFNYQTPYQGRPVFTQLDSASGWHDAYMPLTRLSSPDSIAKVKLAIEVSTTTRDAGGSYRLLHADYGSTGRHDGHFPGTDPGAEPAYAGPDLHTVQPGYNGATDISLAFDAIRKAFLTARYPRETHHVVFLSGGAAKFIDYERQVPTNHTNDYTRGAGMPATSTISFGSPGNSPPPQIQTMSSNIQNNGYSPTNARSDVWEYQGDDSALIDQILGSVYPLGFSSLAFSFCAAPLSFIVNGVAQQSFEGDTAHLAGPFALTGRSTELDISFTVYWPDPLNRDETYLDTIVVTRKAGVVLDASLLLTCWDQGTVQLLYQGNPVNHVNPDWHDLTVRFTPPAGSAMTAATVQDANANFSDQLTLTLANAGQWFEGSFQRQFGAPAADNVLQTDTANDSVIVIWRNPDLPLDTVRFSAPVQRAEIGVRGGRRPEAMPMTFSSSLQQRGGAIEIAVGIPASGDPTALLQIHDCAGRIVSSRRIEGPGYHSVVISKRELHGGMYVAVLTRGGQRLLRTLVVD